MTQSTTKDWRKQSMTWGKRVVLVLLIMCGCAYAVLSLAVRSKDSIRLGLEDYLEQATGENAEITDVTSAQLAPNVMFRLKGVAVRDAKTRNTSLAKAEQVYISMPLWRLMANSRWYNGFEVRGLELASGFFLPKKLTLDFAGISDPSGGKETPNVVMEGHYNNKDLLLTAEMVRKERKKGPLYGFADVFPVTFKLGELQGHGFYVREWNRIDLKDIIVTRGDQSAKFTVEDFGSNPLKGDLKGTLNDVAFTGVLTQSGENTVLSIVPEGSAAQFEVFAKALHDDMGLAPEGGTFRIEIKTDIKESDTE